METHHNTLKNKTIRLNNIKTDDECRLDSSGSLILTEEKTNFKKSKTSKTIEKDKKVIPKNRCQICRKKVGILGFKCDSCSYNHCSEHRLPECHNCLAMDRLIQSDRENLTQQLKPVFNQNNKKIDKI